jgi:S-adenosylmethionine synthetase
MIRFSEMVLPGHPDKFCDQIADAIVARCEQADPDAYCQVEVGAWCDQVWISGGFTVRPGEDLNLDEIVRETVSRVGYKNASGGPRVFKVLDSACRHHDDPRNWTHKVNDQAICVGWAGYDLLTRFHTPEHFLAHTFREALWNAIKGGPLEGQGPDGKLLVVMAEEGPIWRLEQLLVTLQQSHDHDFLAFTKQVEGVLRATYEITQNRDPRWTAPWDEINLTINPNGPLLDAGTEGDNGQTGRKLAIDYYGPRIGQGGGALSGKHFTHIDRIGSYAAREVAVMSVQSGARTCRVMVAYAPNRPEPLEVTIEVEGMGQPIPSSFFDHGNLSNKHRAVRINLTWAQGTHFWDLLAE